MFDRGVHPEDKVSSWCYDESEEDFTKGEKTATSEYMDNIIHVDKIVQEVERMLTGFYEHDDTPEDTSGTAYVFTADHGMSAIGNHGDGDPDNTRTPLIAWGAGVRGPVLDANFGSALNSTHDSYSNPGWGTALTRLARADVQQADVAALMAALLGSDWPMNSVGVVPGLVDGPGYLKEEDARGSEQMARIAMVNARASRHLRYRPFPPLAPAAGGALPPGALELRELERLLAARDWQTTRIKAKQLIDITLEGLGYLQRYDRYILRFIVTTGYVGWMIFSALHVLHTHVVPSAPPGKKPVGREGLSVLDVFGITILTTTAGVFAYQHSPWTYYLYVVFPVYFGRSILKEGNALYEVLEKGVDWGTFPTPEAVLGWGVGIVAVLECMVLAYTHRELWTVLFVILGVGLTWTAGCLGSGVFTVLSVEKTESIALISLGAVAISFLGFAASQMAAYNEAETVSSNRSLPSKLSSLTRIQMLAVVAALLTTVSSVHSLQNKQGLPVMNQFAGWAILVASVVIPTFAPSPTSTPTSKLQQYFLAFGPLFVLLSISTEGLFYASFSLTLYVWVEVEARLYRFVEEPTRRRTAAKSAKQDRGWRAEALSRSLGEDARDNDTKKDTLTVNQPRGSKVSNWYSDCNPPTDYGLITRLISVASVSSFYLEPVYRLIPVFNPFFMASLLIFKIVAPYVILSTVFATLNARVALPPFALFKVALGLTDVMSLTFFYLVRDTGSWLEIGQSISFYVITSLLLVWSAGICAAGDWLMRGTTFEIQNLHELERQKGDRKVD
ncbi:Glycosyl phosphatidyl inositol anchor synthesis [Ceratobasidium sp. 414]|nr:Glycosyl phosphatidyl inositol anchor synthesis [Ceratobasidium sp. 414]